ncbi:MAG: Hut operon regulatory protein HutP [Thermoanaerobacterales bacterium 50_218]|nr:MAG: Hut operon regulatory protein HutP [Thermoanaerobacterales bacterium 50_218]HAA89473.1 hut operon positive regulator HutP [Peptococcaceae bacterium]
MSGYGSRQVAKIAILMALTEDREEEVRKKADYARLGIKTAAVDCGGEFVSSAKKFIESAIVAAKREGVIKGTHSEEGAVAGATREALNQISLKAVGFNVGGKIGIARYGDHISVAAFFGIGLLHLDEVAVGLGHRAVS